MANDVRLVAFAMLAFVTTYWLHSTLLLAATWMFVRTCRVRSEVLRERLWKMAAVIPLFTAPLELTLHLSQPVAQIALDRLCRSSAVTGTNEGPKATAQPTNWTPPILRPMPSWSRGRCRVSRLTWAPRPPKSFTHRPKWPSKRLPRRRK